VRIRLIKDKVRTTLAPPDGQKNAKLKLSYRNTFITYPVRADTIQAYRKHLDISPRVSYFSYWSQNKWIPNMWIQNGIMSTLSESNNIRGR
jgi:hypothetical protein